MNYDIIYANAIRLIGRTVHWKQDLNDSGKGYDGYTMPYSMEDIERMWAGRSDPSNPKPEANLISSRLENGNHAPALDIDFPIHAIPSSTPGHFHLYFEKEMSWEDYAKLLKVMHEVGLIESGYFNQARELKQTFLRLPYVKKEVKKNG